MEIILLSQKSSKRDKDLTVFSRKQHKGAEKIGWHQKSHHGVTSIDVVGRECAMYVIQPPSYRRTCDERANMEGGHTRGSAGVAV